MNHDIIENCEIYHQTELNVCIKGFRNYFPWNWKNECLLYEQTDSLTFDQINTMKMYNENCQ